MPLLPLPAPRVVHLDAPWLNQVRTAEEACLLLDEDGRVAALSRAAGELLELDPTRCVGAGLDDLLLVIDFTETGVPMADARAALPPLRSLSTGRLTRGLVRLRLPGGATPTLDVVGVPVGGGALGFLSEV